MVARLQAHLHCLVTSIHEICGLEGDVAQLGERSVRNAEVVGSNPIVSTNDFKGLAFKASSFLLLGQRFGQHFYLGSH